MRHFAVCRSAVDFGDGLVLEPAPRWRKQTPRQLAAKPDDTRRRLHRRHVVCRTTPTRHRRSRPMPTATPTIPRSSTLVAATHQHHRQRLAPGLIPSDAGHLARKRRRKFAQRQPPTFRVKYAFAQVGLDDWMEKGSLGALGIQQTPWVDFEEGIYRYRFQGTVFSGTRGLPFVLRRWRVVPLQPAVELRRASTSASTTVRTTTASEVNSEKALQIRGSVRPFAQGPLWRVAFACTPFSMPTTTCAAASAGAGHRRDLRASTAERRHRYLDTADRTSVTRTSVSGHGFSMATPRAKNGWKRCFALTICGPGRRSPQPPAHHVGAAYWFPSGQSVSSAPLLDFATDKPFSTTATPAQRRVADVAEPA